MANRRPTKGHCIKCGARFQLDRGDGLCGKCHSDKRRAAEKKLHKHGHPSVMQETPDIGRRIDQLSERVPEGSPLLYQPDDADMTPEQERRYREAFCSSSYESFVGDRPGHPRTGRNWRASR